MDGFSRDGQFRGRILLKFSNLYNSDNQRVIDKVREKVKKVCQKICTVQKKAVTLHRKKGNTKALKQRKNIENAKIAQLVEHDLAKVGVAGSSPVFRSKEH